MSLFDLPGSHASDGRELAASGGRRSIIKADSSDTRMSPLAAALDADRGLPASRLVDSAPLGWRHVLVRAYQEQADVSEFETLDSQSLLLVLVTRGRYLIESRRRDGWVRSVYHPGSLGITAPGRTSVLRWRTASPEPLESLQVHLSLSLVSEVLKTTKEGSDKPEVLDELNKLEVRDPFVVEACGALGRAVVEGAPDLYTETIALALATHLVRISSSGLAEAPTGGLTTNALRDVVEYMYESLGQDLSLDALAEVAHLSKYHFARQFKTATKTTPYAYLTNLRMERATGLLGSDMSIEAIAHDCGYRSVNQFALVFKRAHGVTPSRYRTERSNIQR